MPEKKPRIERLSPAPGQRILVVSDVHGNLPYLRGALDRAHFGGDDLLIFDGDFLEKGEQSLDTLHAVMELCAAGRARAVCGNCDEWAEIFSMDRDTDARIREYLLWRGCGLIWDMCARIGRSVEEPDFTALKAALREPFAAEWDFLARIPHAIETEHYIFAHAGAHAGKPLEEHRVQELVKYDNFLRSDESFDKWIVVGHWPVVLYGESVVNANPIVDRQRKIISIDGGCVLKDDGQLNVLIIPEEGSEDFSLTLLYGARRESDILFREELDGAAACSEGRIKVVYVLSDEQKEGYEHGFSTAETVAKYAPGEYPYSVEFLPRYR